MLDLCRWMRCKLPLVLPEHIFEHIVVQKIISHITLAVAWQNDIHSLPKEMAKGTEVFNLIFVFHNNIIFRWSMLARRPPASIMKHWQMLLPYMKKYREFGEYQEHKDKFVYYAGAGLQGLNTFYLETERYRHGRVGFAWPEIAIGR